MIALLLTGHGCQAKSSMVNSIRTNTNFCTVVLNKTPVLGIFATFKVAQGEKRSSNQSPDPKLAFYSECWGQRCIIYILVHNTEAKLLSELSPVKSFFFSFFFVKTHT